MLLALGRVVKCLSEFKTGAMPSSHPDVSKPAPPRSTASHAPTPRLPVSMVQAVSPRTWRLLAAWTSLWWGGVGDLAALFFIGVLDFPTGMKVSLYGISI